MNERIQELAEQAGYTEAYYYSDDGPFIPAEFNKEKFAELIIRECINQAHSVANLRGANDDMVYGADTAALRISKYFGVEE